MSVGLDKDEIADAFGLDADRVEEISEWLLEENPRGKDIAEIVREVRDEFEGKDLLWAMFVVGNLNQVINLMIAQCEKAKVERSIARKMTNIPAKSRRKRRDEDDG